MAICPTCKKTSAPRADNAAFPFCSARCKQVDLGRWLNEEYRVPAEGQGDESSAEDEGAGKDLS